MPEQTPNKNETPSLLWPKEFLVGRHEEIELLRHSITSDEPSLLQADGEMCRTFFMTGDAGVGKKALLHKAMEGAPSNIVLLSAAFPDTQLATPYWPWVRLAEQLLAAADSLKPRSSTTSFRDFLTRTLQTPGTSGLEDYKQVLTRVLGSDIFERYLSSTSNGVPRSPRKSIPKPASLRVRPTSIGSQTSSDAHGANEFDDNILLFLNKKIISPSQFRLAFRQLFRVLTRYKEIHSIVLYLDEMQRGDPDDFKLAETLLNDRLLKDKLIFVGAHMPLSMLHGLHVIKKNCHRQIKTICVPALTLYEVNYALILLKFSSTGKAENETVDLRVLAAELLEKSKGIAFFLKTLVEYLDQRALFTYSRSDRSWEWDIDRIKAELAPYSSVSAIISQEMGRRADLGKMLGFAALLGGNKIVPERLVSVLDDITDEVHTAEYGHYLCGEAVKMGWLRHTRDGRTYKFIHVLLEPCAISLLREIDTVDKLSVRIGLRLRSILDEQPNDEQLLFQTITHLNQGLYLLKTNKERFRLANLNYRAAIISLRKSALFSATHFLRKSISILGDDPFQGMTADFALEASFLLARIEYSCGLLEKGITRAEELTRVAKTPVDRAAACHLEVVCLGLKQKSTTAMDLAMDTVTSYGVNYPRNLAKLKFNWRMSKMRKALKGMKRKDFMALPVVEDENVEFAVEFLRQIREQASKSGAAELVAFSFLVSSELILEKGRHSMTVPTLIGWAAQLIDEGDIEGGFELGQIAIGLAGERSLDQRAVIQYYYHVHHWKHRFAECHEPVQGILEKLIARQDLEEVIASTPPFLCLGWLAKISLKTLIRSCQELQELGINVGSPESFYPVLPMAHMIATLVGDQKALASFSGGPKQGESETAIQECHFFRMLSAYFQNRYEDAGKYCNQLTDRYVEGTDAMAMFRMFFRALVSWTLAKENDKLIKDARARTATLKKWANKGVLHAERFVLLLEIEQASVLCTSGDQQKKLPLQIYEKAVKRSGSRGLHLDMALANERLAVHFARAGNTSLSHQYYGLALEAYQDWGAMAKVRQLRRTMGMRQSMSQREDKALRSSEMLGVVN
eukprot:Nitzschia sp. Nitz4//scaffold28_size193895//58179//61418//NITZ4_001645-RA/size193895-processed-gene-0.257-mRNA-1//-1//CDS//3329545922//2008//frame0